MKAVYYQGSGRFTVGRGEVGPPGNGEVRLDVAYCGLCGTDLPIAPGYMHQRVRPPQVIGHEMAGTVAKVGTRVQNLGPGDDVVVFEVSSAADYVPGSVLPFEEPELEAEGPCAFFRRYLAATGWGAAVGSKDLDPRVLTI